MTLSQSKDPAVKNTATMIPFETAIEPLKGKSSNMPELVAEAKKMKLTSTHTRPLEIGC